MREIELERSHVLLGDDGIEQADVGGMNSVLLHVGKTMDPYEFKVHKPTYYWVDPDNNTSKEEPPFNKVDSPYRQSSFSFSPVFVSVAQGGQYKFHCLPAGCQPVSPNEDNAVISTHGRWNFLPRAE